MNSTPCPHAAALWEADRIKGGGVEVQETKHGSSGRRDAAMRAGSERVKEAVGSAQLELPGG